MALDLLFSPVLLVALVVILVSYYLLQYRRPANYPPGPPMLPLVGSTPFFLKEVTVTSLLALRKRYGPVFSFAVGESRLVVLASYPNIIEACVKRGLDFAGRPFSYKFSKGIPNYDVHKGIFDADYSAEWKSERNYAITVLKGLGYGKSNTENKILEEVDHLSKACKDTKGRPYRIGAHINVAVANIISNLLFGERYDFEDEEFKGLLKVIDNIFQGAVEHTAEDYIPLLRLLPGYKKFLRGFVGSFGKLKLFLQKKIDDQTNEDDLEDRRSFIKEYSKSSKLKEGKKSMALLGHLNDFFSAGMETTNTTLGWGVYYMAKYPDIQTKVQEELDRVIGGDRAVVLKDRDSLPYTQATLLELLRLATTVPFFFHKTMCDTHVAGYSIPKDTEVLMFFWGVQRDPEIWPQPKEFRPERFLNSNGEVVNKEKMLPFGAGRRSCFGEQLAKQELFLFFTNIMKSFRIKLPDNAKLPKDGIVTITHQPPKFEVCMEPRQ